MAHATMPATLLLVAPGAQTTEKATLKGHSPDGKLLASASPDKTVKPWARTRGRESR